VSNRTILTSKIVGVTVYRSGARVTRACEVPVSSEQELIYITIPGLPLSLDDSSLQVSVERGTAEASPVAADFRVVLDAEESLESLRNALLNARGEVSRSERILSRLNGFKKSLIDAGIAKRPKNRHGESPISTPAASRLSWLAFKRERLLALERRIAEQKQIHRDLSKRVLSLEAKERTSSNAVPPRTTELKKALEITLDMRRASAGSATLSFGYVVPGARWAPNYALTLSQETGEVTISLRAAVAQKSGEDWSGVSMTLSTALPSRFSALPDLKALRIGKTQPRTSRKRPCPMPDIDELYRDYDNARASFGLAGPQTTSAPEDDFSENLDVFDDEGMDTFSSNSAPEIPMETTAAGPVMPPVPVPMAAATYIAGASPMFGGQTRDEPALSIADEPPDSALATDLLDYGNLHMSAPNTAGRGRVSPRSRHEQYLELWTRQRVSVNIDVIQAIRLAMEAAREVETTPLPAKHHSPRPQAGFAHAYAGEHSVDIPSDGQFHTIVLTMATARGAMRYVSVPREIMQVFRSLTFDNPFDAPLLSGPVEITSNGRHLPPGEIDAAPTGGEVMVWLGVEQGIKISRNTEYKEETAGLLRGHIALEHAISVDIINHLNNDVEMEVRERIPVIQEDEEDVEVSVKRVSPKWISFEQKEHPLKGGYCWRFPLDSGKKQRLEASYTITIPSKYQLIGGNRREV
jgi:hypothetical protein